MVTTDLSAFEADLPDDKNCPQCGSGDYWLYEVEKECKACAATWTSAWSLAHNDVPPEA